MHVDVTGLAAVDRDRDHLAGLVLGFGQDHRADRVQIPHVVGDVLEVGLVGAGVQIDRDDRVGVQVVAGTDVAVQVGRGVAHHEVHGPGLPVDRRRHPHAAAQGLVEAAALSASRSAFSLAMSRCMLRPVASCVRPHALVALLGDGVERPQQLAALGVEGLDEAADAVLAAVGADQHLAVHHDRSHGFGVALLGIGDLGLPQHLAGLRVERHQLGVERAHVEHVVGRSPRRGCSGRSSRW